MSDNKKRKKSFISSEKGQRFFNFAYSIGAAIVIWGALFKILHLPGGNMLLSIGMGTEVLMFILTAFDRPPKDYKWEDVFPVLDSGNDEDRPEFATGTGLNTGTAAKDSETATDGDTDMGPAQIQSPLQAQIMQQPAPASDVATATQNYLEQLNAITTEMSQLRESTQALNHVSEVLLQSYRAITENSENITRSSTGYVEQMGDLSRNIQGLNTIYEIQLKSISSQLDAIDRVNRGIKDIRDMYEKSSEQSARYCEETEKMARYMQQLNGVYEKMITAMTINMYNPMMPQQAPAQQPAAQSDDKPEQ